MPPIKTRRNLNYLEAIAALVGTVIGAGVLGIPYVFAQVGFWIGCAFMVVVTVIVLMLHLMLGEVVVRTKEPLQLAGLTRKYLGKTLGTIMAASYILALNGALLAYVVGSGDVLSAMLPGGSFVWSLVFFVFGSAIVLRGVGVAKHVEFVLNVMMFAVIVAILFLSLQGFSVENLTHVDTHKLFLPFGVILFALSGISAIPIIEIIDKKKRELKRVIVWGTLIPAVTYIFFALVVVGVTGLATTQVATIGLGHALGSAMLLFGNIFALFAMGTSFILIGLALSEVYDWDFGISAKKAVWLTVAAPLLLFLLGAREFITILGLVGSLFVSLEMIFLVFVFLKVRQKKVKNAVAFVRWPYMWAVILITVFVVAGSFGVWNWVTM